MERPAVDEIHEQAEKKVEEEKASVVGRIPTKVKWLLGIATLIAIYLIWNKTYSLQKILLVLLGVYVLIYLIYSTEAVKKGLTDRELRIMLYEQLKWYQNNPFGDVFLVPQGKIILELPTRKRWLEKEPWKKTSAFSILKENMFREHWTAEQDINTGDIITFKKEYFDGRQAGDIIYIRSPEVEKERRYHETRGKK